MSYARFKKDYSDVFVFDHIDGDTECCGCLLQSPSLVTDYNAPNFPTFATHAATIEHLKEHLAAGHLVPDKTFAKLQESPDNPG